MIIKTYCASDIFSVRLNTSLVGNPEWANLTIDSNRALSNEEARGAGLYAIHFRGALLYVGKFCGKHSDPFAGRICDIRWSRHIGTLTLRDRRISLSEGRIEQLRRSSAVPLTDIVQAMPAQTIYQNRGRATSINRALFAAEHWAEFARIEDAIGLTEFQITYVQIEPTAAIDQMRVRDIVSRAEKFAINRLQPRCNGEIREGMGMSATLDEAREVLAEMLEESIGRTPQLDLLAEIPDPEAPDHGVPNGPPDVHVENQDDPVNETPEELFWERIEGEAQAEIAAELLIEALSEVPDADYHFTSTNSADLRVHSLAGTRARFNVACLSWQTRLRRYISEIGLPVDSCIALGATTARPNHAGKTLSTIATFDHDCQPDAIRRCTLAALALYREQCGR